MVDLFNRRRFLKATGVAAAMLPIVSMSRFVEGATVQRPTGLPPVGTLRHTLWYGSPATESNVLREGLPIGNGRVGALVGGDPARDFLYLTDGSMWLGDRNTSLGGDGQFGYTTAHFGSLVMLARLYLSVTGHEFAAITDYRRELDLEQGYIRVSYRKDGVTYVREIFASHPDDVVVLHLSQSGKGTYGGHVDLQGLQGEKTAGEADDALRFDSVLANGLKYAAHVRAIATGGHLSVSAGELHFAHCDALTVVFCGGTNYTPDASKGYIDATLDPSGLSSRKADAAAAQGAATLLHTHVADHRKLFDAMHVELGVSTDRQRSLDTWTRLQARAATGSDADPELEASYLQFGRYLTIAGSRNGLPTGLQGLWLSDNAPAWMADYHNDINVQMNYWLPDRAGLPSCFDALANYCLSQVGAWTAATQRYFNDPRNVFRNSSGKVAGWTLAISTNIYGGGGWRWHPAGNAWLCNNLWQHYQYTLDRDYLLRIYPLLMGACQFWEARLRVTTVTDPVTGLAHEVLIDDADWSPEQGPSDAKGITYAQEWVWDLFENYCQASSLLDRDTSYSASIAQLQARLYLPRVSDKTGWLEEWMTPDNLGETTHRHLSPLVGFFPGDRIRTDAGPRAMIEGVTRLLEARGMTGYGWGCAWRAICWARLGQAEKAYQLLLTNLSPSRDHSNGTAQNFFDFYRLTDTSDAFQIDANFGTPTAMLEMLLYSRPGWIELLPALPKAWAASGKVTGVGARGGFQVDFSWRQGKLASVTLRSVGGDKTHLKCGQWSRTITLDVGKSITLEHQDLEHRDN